MGMGFLGGEPRTRGRSDASVPPVSRSYAARREFGSCARYRCEADRIGFTPAASAVASSVMAAGSTMRDRATRRDLLRLFGAGSRVSFSLSLSCSRRFSSPLYATCFNGELPYSRVRTPLASSVIVCVCCTCLLTFLASLSLLFSLLSVSMSHTASRKCDSEVCQRNANIADGAAAAVASYFRIPHFFLR